MEIETHLDHWKKKVFSVNLFGNLIQEKNIENIDFCNFLKQFVNNDRNIFLDKIKEIFGLNEKICERLVKYYYEIGSLTENSQSNENLNNRSSINNSSSFPSHFSIVLDPLFFIPNFHQTNYQIEIDERSEKLSALADKIEDLNEIACDLNQKILYNLPIQINRIYYKEGIKNNGISQYFLKWEKEKRMFAIQGVDIPDLYLNEHREEYTTYYQALEDIIRNKDKMKIKIGEWLKSLDFSFPYNFDLDFEHYVINVKIVEKKLSLIENHREICKIYNILHQFDNKSFSFKFENDWICDFKLKFHIIYEQLSIFLKHLFQIPSFFEENSAYLYNSNISTLILHLNSKIDKKLTNIFVWNQELLKSYFYSICERERDRIYDILLAKCLQNQIFE